MEDYNDNKFHLDHYKKEKEMKATKFILLNRGNLPDFYRIGKRLGSGACGGEIRLCTHKESG